MEKYPANLYIDGFNLYYGLLKGTSYKWLNPLKLVNQILPYLEIQKVDYFTADIKVFPIRMILVKVIDNNCSIVPYPLCLISESLKEDIPSILLRCH